jgi:dimethylamine/trimethylamine dehydrogenase
MSRTDPVQSKAMDRADIRSLRRAHRAAALRAIEAGFDIVYVYATHGYLLSEFLSRAHNQRTDDYGGRLENRVRLVRELIEETKDAVGHKAAVAVRMSANGHGQEHLDAAETRDMLAMLGHLPDLWDMVIDTYDVEMGSSRFVEEGAHEKHVAWVKAATGKPVVSVGRFTSPDAMAAQVRRGVLDFIGAARPSIADPFLPRKIAEGRVNDIRECIGCNVCYAGDARGVPIRCTQNPSMGEEWRSGWHPEKVPQARKPLSVLIVGAGPAGLEAAQALGKAGCRVTLAERSGDLGGRVARESRLPGLSAWGRVRDWRAGQIAALPNVEVFRGSEMSAADIRGFGADQVLIATGERWRCDGVGRFHALPIAGLVHAAVYTPDDIMDGRLPAGRVLLFDDDSYYMGPVIALALAQKGAAVTYVTPEGCAGAWSANTAEQSHTQRAMLAAGIIIETNTALVRAERDRAVTGCIYSGAEREHAADAGVLVTGRTPSDALYRAFAGDGDEPPAGVRMIGDCLQPALIAHAVHCAAMEILTGEAWTPKRDRLVISSI